MSVGSVNIVREGLVLCLDGENIKSYPGSGDNWYDITSNYNNGVLTNGATFSPSGNGSIEFDGVNDYVSINNSNILTPNEITFSAWINRTQIGYYSQVMGVPVDDVSWSNPFTSYSLEFIDSTNTMSFTLGFTDNTYEYTTCDTFGINQWFNITGTYDGINVNVYINGELKTTRSETKTLINSTSKFYIGSNNSSSSFSFSGKVSNVLLYNRPLTPSEVLQNYNSIKWRFMNESEVLPSIVTDQLVLNLDPSDPSSYPGSGTNWYDLTAYNNDGVLTNGVVYNNSLYGGGMDFDGINDYVTIPSSTSLNPTHTITLCAWVNYNGVYSGYSAPIVFKRNTQMNYFEQYIFGFSTSGKIGLALGDDANTNDFTETTSSYINQLINVVGIIDTLNSVMKIYINGILESSKIITYPNMYISTNPVIIGSYNEPSFNGFMGGGIYNVLIYGKALSEEEILQNYNVQKSRYGL